MNIKIDHLERRMNKNTSMSEVKIEGVWVCVEALQDAYIVFHRDTYIKEFREVFGDGVGDWLEENYS